MRRSALILTALAALAACAEGPRHGLPSTGRKIALRPISNKSQQFGLEDALALAVRDEFLRDGRYELVPESEAEDVVAIEITRYVLTPLAYDATLSPISYKLRVMADIRMVEGKTSRVLWAEKDLEGSLTYPNQILAGGQTEDQARATIWAVLAPMIVLRVADGFDAAPAKPAASMVN